MLNFVDADACLPENTSNRSDRDLAVIRNTGRAESYLGLLAELHMTSFLMDLSKTCRFQSALHFTIPQ
jgi:hypothetical protein